VGEDFSVFELNKGLDIIKRDSTSSDEIPDRQKFSIFSRARKSSIQSLRSLSFSFRELFASKKMVQITLIQSVGWIAAAIVLQGLSSENSSHLGAQNFHTNPNFISSFLSFLLLSHLDLIPNQTYCDPTRRLRMNSHSL